MADHYNKINVQSQAVPVPGYSDRQWIDDMMAKTSVDAGTVDSLYDVHHHHHHHHYQHQGNSLDELDGESDLSHQELSHGHHRHHHHDHDQISEGTDLQRCVMCDNLV